MRRRYPDELRADAVRRYREADPKPSIRQLARQLGVHPEALRCWIRQDEAECGDDEDEPSTGGDRSELLRLRRENAELRRVNEILVDTVIFFGAQLDTVRRPPPD